VASFRISYKTSLNEGQFSKLLFVCDVRVGTVAQSHTTVGGSFVAIVAAGGAARRFKRLCRSERTPFYYAMGLIRGRQRLSPSTSGEFGGHAHEINLSVEFGVTE
jgi:hypothetical protein